MILVILVFSSPLVGSVGQAVDSSDADFGVGSSRIIVQGRGEHDFMRPHIVGRVSVLERADGDLCVTGYMNRTPLDGDNVHANDIWEFIVSRR